METVQDKLKVSIAYTLKERTGKILEEVPDNFPFVYTMKTKAYERHRCKSVVSPFQVRCKSVRRNDHKAEFQDTITNLNGDKNKNNN